MTRAILAFALLAAVCTALGFFEILGRTLARKLIGGSC